MSARLELSAYCIYTIRRTADLDRAFQHGGKGQFTENTGWVSGKELLSQATQAGARLPIVFGRADGDVSEIIYCGLLDQILGARSARDKTLYVFSGLTAIEPPLPLSRLTLKAKKRPLSSDFIRPYALCLTPQFVRNLLGQG